MALIRVNKNNGYSLMSNHHLRDIRMSLKAKGLLSYMFSLPEDWDYSVKGLVSKCKEGTDTVESTLRELKELGYLQITKKFPNETKSGRIEYVYDIFEFPLDVEKQEGEKQPLEKQPLENPPLNQLLNNQILNNKLLNKEKNKKKKVSFGDEL